MQNLIMQAHPQWQPLVERALEDMDKQYLNHLQSTKNWLPGINSLFAAFSLPLTSTRYILLGESPYPRAQSANGYAFWDEAVGSIWSEKGLSKQVNRATSLRNLIKMMLVARGDLLTDLSQEAIAKLDKSNYIQTADQLFTGFMKKGILLLNASLVYSENQVPYHARQWRPFVHSLFQQLALQNNALKLILLGKIAEQLPKTDLPPVLSAEHPYNISFITNSMVIDFFKPLDLLCYDSKNDR